MTSRKSSNVNIAVDSWGVLTAAPQNVVWGLTRRHHPRICQKCKISASPTDLWKLTPHCNKSPQMSQICLYEVWRNSILKDVGDYIWGFFLLFRNTVVIHSIIILLSAYSLPWTMWDAVSKVTKDRSGFCTCRVISLGGKTEINKKIKRVINAIKRPQLRFAPPNLRKQL